MSFIKRLKDKWAGSDLDLKGPDFSSAPTHTIDLQVAKYRFKHGPHTSMYPVDEPCEYLDISREGALEKQPAGDYAKIIYKRGWDFQGHKWISKGGVSLRSYILGFNNMLYKDKYYNCFKRETLEDQILLFIHDIYGFQNDSPGVGDPGDGYFTYPTHSNDLQYKTINKTKWCFYKAGAKGKSGDTTFITPLSPIHILALRFIIETYQDTDYYSPETNFKTASENTVEEFMTNVYIELSAESQKSQLLANPKIG